MTLLHETLRVFWQEALTTSKSGEDVNSFWTAIDAVQLGLDITFDNFYTIPLK